MKKNILFITESYHYNPSPNGHCIEKIVNELIKNNYNAFILTLKNQYEKDNLKNINNVNVYRVNSYLEWRLLYNKLFTNLIGKIIIKIITYIKYLLIPFHPFRSPEVLYELYRKAKYIINNEDIDIIVSVYRDFETALCGALIKKKYLNKKVFLYTLDAISGGVNSNKLISEKFHKKKCIQWELYFLEKFDLFFAMKSHTNLYNNVVYNNYKSKIIFLDIPNLIYTKKYKLSNNNIPVFVFTGMLSLTNADCSYFLKIFQEICKKQKCIFKIYGGISKEIEQKIKNTGLFNKNIFFYGSVSQQELHNVRNDSDIFLNFGNNHECGIPCKIFEYISTGKIIISFAKINSDASTVYLKKYSNALILKEDNNKILEYADKIIDFYNNHKHIQISQEFINKNFYENTPNAFIDIIKKYG